MNRSKSLSALTLAAAVLGGAILTPSMAHAGTSQQAQRQPNNQQSAQRQANNEQSAMMQRKKGPTRVQRNSGGVGRI